MKTETYEAIALKYTPVSPRYTSYPTANCFHSDFTPDDYIKLAHESNEYLMPHPLSMYVHIPFCSNVCFYCACNKIITRDQQKAATYVEYIKKEIELKSRLFDPDREILQLHFGGGTPTFLSTEQLEEILSAIFSRLKLSQNNDAEISIEIDPRTIDTQYLERLKNIGFNRISLGVQDVDCQVQQAINRIQPLEMNQELFSHARKLGFESINLDLMYGLPHQTVQSFKTTLEKIVELKPDRISMFNYAHLPQRFKPQTRIKDKDLPAPADKLAIYLGAIDQLKEAGYQYIGMDHFALPDDQLNQAQKNKTLHRNFQGYTTHAHCDLVAFGVSGIGYLDDCYVQNHHTLDSYYQDIDAAQLPVSRGMVLTADDKLRRHIIMELMCLFQLDTKQVEKKFAIDFKRYFASELKQLVQMQNDELLTISDTSIQLTLSGRLFVRLICNVFDSYSVNKENAGSSKVI